MESEGKLTDIMSDEISSKSSSIYIQENRMVSSKEYNTVWNTLKSAIQQIFENHVENLSFENLYRLAYTLVISKHSEKLYSDVVGLLQSWIYQNFQTKFAIDFETDCIGALHVLTNAWDYFCNNLKMISSIFMYLDNILVEQDKKKVYAKGMEIFNTSLIEKKKLRSSIKAAAACLIKRVVEENFSCLYNNSNKKDALANSAGYMINKEYNLKILGNLTKMFVHLGIVLEADNSIVNPYKNYDSYLRKPLTNYKLYEEYIESQVIHCIGDYHKKTSAEMYDSLSKYDFLLAAANAIHTSVTFADGCLIKNTTEKIKKCVRNSWIRDRYLQILQDQSCGFEWMILKNRVDDLRKLCMVTPMGGKAISELDQIFKNTLLLEGSKIIDAYFASASSKVEMIFRDLMNLKRKYKNILEKSFRNDKTLEDSLESGFKFLLNQESSVSFYLCLTFHEMLSKQKIRSLKGLIKKNPVMVNPESKADYLYDKTPFKKKLDELLNYLELIDDRYLIKSYLEQTLASRLLTDNGTNCSLEARVLLNLDSRFGMNFSERMKAMLKDIEKSRISASNLPSWIYSPLKNEINFNVSVVSHLFWQLPKVNFSVNIPAEFKELQNSYERLFMRNNFGKKIKWLYNQGTGTLQVKLNSETIYLELSTVSMIILLIFNERTHFTLSEINAKLCPNDQDEIRNELFSLTSNQTFKILRVTSADGGFRKLQYPQDIEPSDVFRINEDAYLPSKKITIPYMFFCSKYARKSDESSPKDLLPENMELDPSLTIQSFVTKIMKQQRKLNRKELFVKLHKEFGHRFVLTEELIEKQILSLLEKDIIEVENAYPLIYHYVV